MALQNSIKAHSIVAHQTSNLISVGHNGRITLTWNIIEIKVDFIDIIDSIFLANKIELSKEVPISKNGLSFNATGYNEKHNIGYVWLDHQSTASDCFNSWRSSLNKSA